MQHGFLAARIKLKDGFAVESAPINIATLAATKIAYTVTG